MYNNTDFLNYSDHEKKDYLLEKNQNGEYKRTEEERYNLIGYINDSNDVIKVAMTLSEEKRLDERIVNKLNNWDLAIMLMETANVEMIKKYISKISNFKRIEIISQNKFDNKTKVELIKYLDNDTDKIKIMEDIQDDELLKESLQYIKGESIKAKIINRISNVETRIILVKELQSSTERLNVFKTLDSETQIKYIDEFNLTDSQKKEVLTSKDETGTYKFNEEVRLDIIQNMNSSSDICSIAQTLSEEKRTDERILKKLNNWDLKQLIKTVTNID